MDKELRRVLAKKYNGMKQRRYNQKNSEYWCEVPYKDCPHWQGTFCELDVEAEKMDELKPCPFCGGEAVVTKHHNRFTEWYLCSCPKCHISQTGSEYGFRFESVEAWNRRADE